MKAFLVVNPRSANGATGRHFDTISQAVRSAVGDHGHAFTEGPMHAAEVARKALGDGCELVIAVGGDGTVNEVVNGFFEPARPGEPPRPVRPGAALAVLPRGTGGDFRRMLKVDGDLRSNALRLRGERAPIDVGRVEFLDPEGRRSCRYFINVAEVGVGARVVEIANRGSKALGGKLTFMLASLRALAGWRDVPVRVSYDGAPFEDLEITALAIANGRYFGGGMMVAPEARLDDGLFHVTEWSGYKLMDFILKSRAMYDGSHTRLPGTRTRTARSVAVEEAPRLQRRPGVEIDGERIGSIPATFTVLPGALHLVR